MAPCGIEREISFMQACESGMHFQCVLTEVVEGGDAQLPAVPTAALSCLICEHLRVADDLTCSSGRDGGLAIRPHKTRILGERDAWQRAAAGWCPC